MNKNLSLIALVVLLSAASVSAFEFQKKTNAQIRLELPLRLRKDEFKMTEHSMGDPFGHAFATLIKVAQMIALLMCLGDCLARYYGKPLHYTHTLRFAIFVYGACCPWLLGGNNNQTPGGYRGFNDRIFYHFFDLIYHGYWGWGYFDCFNHRITVDGKPYGFNYINILPIEILLFMLGKAAEWTSRDSFARRNRFVQLISSAKGLYLEFYGFPYAGWATFFYKQHFELLEFEREGKVVTGRNDIVYWMSWALALWMTFETARSIWEVYTGNRDSYCYFLQNDPRETRKQLEAQAGITDKKGYEQVSLEEKKDKKAIEEELQKKINADLKARDISVGENHWGSDHPADWDAHPDDCQYIAVYIEYWFIYQHSFKNAYNKLSQYYFTIFLCRWVIFAIFAIVWYKHTRTIYIVFLVLNLLMIGVTVISRRSFRMWYFWWILAEEILVLVWHISSLILMIDYYANGTLGQKSVNFLTNIAFWPYVLTVSAEGIHMLIPLLFNTEYYSHFKMALPKVKEEEEEKKVVKKDEVHPHLKLNHGDSAEELHNNMSKYNKHKSQVEVGQADKSKNGIINNNNQNGYHN